MARFLTILKASKTGPKDAAWELLEPLVYCSDLLFDTIVVPKGFCTDYASVPRLPLAYLLTGDTVHAPAVVHDYLIVSGKVARSQADAIFLEAMRADNVSWWRRYAMYYAVSGYTLFLDLMPSRSAD